MALTFPFPLAFLSDELCTGMVMPDFQRHDEMSGSADSRFWSAEMARPLWTFSFPLAARSAALARPVDAKIRALGVNKPFLFADPSYRINGQSPGTGVTIGSVAADRTQISLSGLPAGFTVNAGMRFSVPYGSGRVFLGEAAEPRTATALGNASLFAISPFLPLSITAGAAVEMIKPVVKVIIPPGGYTPFGFDLGGIARPGALSLLQKA